MSDDLISRQAAIDYCYDLINAEHLDLDEMNYSQERVNQTEVILHHLEFMPAVAPVRMKGKWIDSEPDRNSLHKSGMAFFCSNCHHSAGKHKHTTYKFCPWCGADMRDD